MYALIKNNIVVNVIEADANFAASISPDWDAVVRTTAAGIGWAYLAGVFTAPPPPLVVVLPPTVPIEITMRQARLVLNAGGYIGTINATIAAMPGPQKEQAAIEWEYSNTVQRHNGFVSALGPALGLTGVQIDALFIAGSKL